MNEKELLLAFVSKALGIDASGVSSLIYNEDGAGLKDNALDTLLAKQGDFINRVKSTAATGKLNEGHKAGVKEALTKLEQEIKEKYQLDSSAMGIDLIDELVESRSTDNAGNAKPITDDEIKKSKIYNDLHAELQRVKKESDKRVSEEVNKVKSEWKQSETMRDLRSITADWLKKNKAVLSTDPSKARNQMGLMNSHLEKHYNFEFQGEGDSRRIIVLDKEGKVAEDSLGHPIEFDTLLSTVGNMYYDFEQSDKRNTPPDPTKIGEENNGGKGGVKHGITLRKPTSQQEWFAQHEQIEQNANLKPEQKSELQSDLMKLYKGEAEPAAK